MRERVRPRLRFLLDRKEIRRSKSTIDIIAKELDSATYDLEAARESLNNRSYKWATIQAYHSMFHAARALLNRMGYREQSHNGLVEALHQLYEREIVEKILKDFHKAMTLTEQLHDSLTVSGNVAKSTLKSSENFLEEAARVLAAPREWFEKPAHRPSLARKKKRSTRTTVAKGFDFG